MKPNGRQKTTSKPIDKQKTASEQQIVSVVDKTLKPAKPAKAASGNTNSTIKKAVSSAKPNTQAETKNEERVTIKSTDISLSPENLAKINQINTSEVTLNITKPQDVQDAIIGKNRSRGEPFKVQDKNFTIGKAGITGNKDLSSSSFNITTKTGATFQPDLLKDQISSKSPSHSAKISIFKYNDFANTDNFAKLVNKLIQSKEESVKGMKNPKQVAQETAKLNHDLEVLFKIQETVVEQLVDKKLVEEKERIPKPVVEEPTPPVIEKPTPPVVEDPKPPVVKKPDPEKKDPEPEKKDPDPVVVEEPKPPVLEEPKKPVLEEPKKPVLLDPEEPVLVYPPEPVLVDPDRHPGQLQTPENITPEPQKYETVTIVTNDTEIEGAGADFKGDKNTFSFQGFKVDVIDENGAKIEKDTFNATDFSDQDKFKALKESVAKAYPGDNGGVSAEGQDKLNALDSHQNKAQQHVVTPTHPKDAEIHQTVNKDGTVHRKINVRKGDVTVTKGTEGSELKTGKREGTGNPNPEPFIETNGTKLYYSQDSAKFLAEFKSKFSDETKISFYDREGNRVHIRDGKAVDANGNELPRVQQADTVVKKGNETEIAGNFIATEQKPENKDPEASNNQATTQGNNPENQNNTPEVSSAAALDPQARSAKSQEEVTIVLAKLTEAANRVPNAVTSDQSTVEPSVDVQKSASVQAAPNAPTDKVDQAQAPIDKPDQAKTANSTGKSFVEMLETQKQAGKGGPEGRSM